MPEWKMKLKGKTLPKNPITVDVRDSVEKEGASQSVAAATKSKAEAFGKKGARGGGSGNSFKLPSSKG